MSLKRPEHLLLILSVFALFSIAALLGVDARKEYQRELAGATEALDAETRLLAEHARLSLHTAALFLEGIALDMQRAGLDQRASDENYWHSLRALLDHTPQLTSVVVTNAQGEVRLSSIRHPANGFSIADREYFAVHQQGRRHFLSAPVLGRDSGRELIPISLRIENARGQFEGVVVAALDLAYFYAFFDSVPSRYDRRVGMYLQDGTVLALHPAEDALANYSLSHVVRQLMEVPSRIYTGDSPLDGRKKIISYRFLDDYPIALSVGFDHEVFMAGLRPVWIRVAATFLLFAAGIIVSTIFLVRSIHQADAARKRERKLGKEQRRSERLSRAITRHLPNGRVAVLNRRLCYVFAEGREFNKPDRLGQEQSVGSRLSDAHEAATAAILESLARQAFGGTESEAEVVVKEQTFKVIAVPLKDERERVDQVLLLSQDISDLKNTQKELEAHNQVLRELTLTDPLLGIANRRALDQTLERQWRRCLRRQRYVALLMIDVDHFKHFNDNYGHSHGDQCLRQVATALSAALLRPFDIVARYGGEEMAVLLPECDLEGALSVAERIHRRLAAEAIPFANSPGRPQVTVSIGAASRMPRPDVPAAILISEADAALYRAKQEGRNRTVVSQSAPAI